MVGFKGVFNDMYARDISKKIRAGYRQKQKDGLVLIPPMGYFKDKNTKNVAIVEEHAEIVRRIFKLYISGYGIKSIAKILNADGIKSPGYYQKQLLGKNIGYHKPEIAHRFLWENTAVKRILQNEFYIGTVVCHKSYTSKINHIRKDLPEEEHYRHENFVPPIISKEIWEQVQFLLSDKPKRNVRASSGNPCHRYTGLIKCGDCGCSFSCKIRKWKDKPERLEYTCTAYHRYGKENCTPHRVDEATLDKLIYDELMQIKDLAKKNFTTIETDVKKWISKKNTAENKTADLTVKLNQRKLDQQEILLERIRDKKHAEIYTDMLNKCEIDISKYTEQIVAIKAYDTTIKKRKSEMKQSIDLIDEIISAGAISDTHLRMLVDGIIIHEKNKKLQIVINLKAQFRKHIDFYDLNGEVSDRAFEMWAFEA